MTETENRNQLHQMLSKADFKGALGQLKTMYAEHRELKSSPHFFTLFANFQTLLNRKEAALKAMSKAVELQGFNKSLFLEMTNARIQVIFNNDRKADELYNLFVEENPDSSLGWCERGIFLYHQDKFGPSLESLEIAIEKNPKNLLAQGYRTLELERVGSPKAAESLRRFEAMEGKRTISLLSKAEVYEEIGNHEKARAQLTTVLEQNPNNLAAICLKRESFIKENKFSLARKFERKLERDGVKLESLDQLPDNRFATLGKLLFFLEETKFLRNLGNVQLDHSTTPTATQSPGLRAKTIFPGAERVVVDGEQMDMGDAVATARMNYNTIQQNKFRMADQYFEKAMKKLEVRNYEEAIKFFLQAISHNPDHILALNEMGMTYLMTGDEQGYRIDKAVGYFDEIIRRNPNFAKAHYHKFVAFLLVGNYEAALESIDLAIVSDPRTIEYLIDKGVLLMDIKRHEFAEEVFKEVLEKEPMNSTAWSSLACIYKDMGNKKEEVKCLNNFLKVEPGDVNAWFERGMVFKRFAKYDTAIKCFDHILTVEQGHYLAMKEKGMCQRLMGNRAEGDQLIDQADQNKLRYLNEHLSSKLKLEKKE